LLTGGIPYSTCLQGRGPFRALHLENMRGERLIGKEGRSYCLPKGESFTPLADRGRVPLQPLTKGGEGISFSERGAVNVILKGGSPSHHLLTGRGVPLEPLTIYKII
jgi:hypothetical protein